MKTLRKAIFGTWAAVFAVVGLLFAAAPDFTAASITWASQRLDVQGALDPADLWHVLAVSLMVAITVLSVQAARGETDPFGPLVAAKLTSTVGFLAHVPEGGAWWLCAGADLFVAVTLIAAEALDPDRPDFVWRWLVTNGATPRDLAHWSRRLENLPWHIALLVSLSRFLLDRLAPLLLMGVPRCALSLDEVSFHKLVERVRTHQNRAIRLAWILAIQPTAGALVRSREHAHG